MRAALLLLVAFVAISANARTLQKHNDWSCKYELEEDWCVWDLIEWFDCRYDELVEHNEWLEDWCEEKDWLFVPCKWLEDKEREERKEECRKWSDRRDEWDCDEHDECREWKDKWDDDHHKKKKKHHDICKKHDECWEAWIECLDPRDWNWGNDWFWDVSPDWTIPPADTIWIDGRPGWEIWEGNPWAPQP